MAEIGLVENSRERG